MKRKKIVVPMCFYVSRTTVLDILNSIGLQDPHRQMQKELDSWDIWNIEDADRKKELKMMCSQWLERWVGREKTLRFVNTFYPHLC